MLAKGFAIPRLTLFLAVKTMKNLTPVAYHTQTMEIEKSIVFLQRLTALHVLKALLCSVPRLHHVCEFVCVGIGAIRSGGKANKPSVLVPGITSYAKASSLYRKTAVADIPKCYSLDSLVLEAKPIIF
jgi:hypothetical protein